MKNISRLFIFTAFLAWVHIPASFASDIEEVGPTSTKASVSIEYKAAFETLYITMSSKGGRDKAEVFVLYNGEIVAKDIFVLTAIPDEYTIDLTGHPAGTYTVKVVAPTIKYAERFRKM